MRKDFVSGNDKHDSILSHYRDFFKPRSQVFPFLDTICEVLGGPEDYLSDFNSKQYVLLGQPSAGKTTELRRIAKKLAQNKMGELNENQIVHLCCLQNTSSIQREIESKEDLWGWIMRSHESKNWSLERHSFEAFSKIHSDLNLNPILLVDTVDLLIYGEIGTESGSKIAQIWKELVDDCREKGWTVLWSCRRHEWQIMNVNNPEFSLIEIYLPPLRASIVGEKYAHMKHDSDYLQAHMVTLSLAFPIIVGHKMNFSKKYSIEGIENKFKELHLKMRDVKLNENTFHRAGPTSWIVSEMEGKIATDILYDGIVEKLVQHISKKYHYDKNEVLDYWRKVEREFYYAAKPKSGGARIQIERSYLDAFEDQTLTKAMVIKAQHFGLLDENGTTLEMVHQLFAEYCVWKNLSENDAQMMDKFPSMIFRKEMNKKDNNALEEGAKWFLPYTVFNKELAEIGEDIQNWSYLTQAWKEAAKNAHENQPKAPNLIEKPPQPTDDSIFPVAERDINNEKLQIINSLSGNDPLILNGPPGVGKTHLSYIWMDKIALGDLWVRLEPKRHRTLANQSEKPKAYFMTQSQRLARQISEKVDTYYGRDTRPVEFKDWGVDEYLASLEKVIGKPCQTYTFENFETEWSIYSRGKSEDLRKIPKQALWNEYLHSMINIKGKLKTIEEYKQTRNADIFKFCTNPEKQAHEFAEWACSRHRTKLTLAERAGVMIEKVIQILVDGNLGQKESVYSLQPDILILDEIQDLPAPVILLMLIMHKGKTNSVMMCGDDEQTLELIQFDWGAVFSRVTTAIFELSKEYEKYEHRLDFIQKWKGLKLNKVQQNSTTYMSVVERSIPEIVDVLRESWRTGVASKEMRKSLNIDHEKGTGAITPGEFSFKRLEHNNKNNQDQGVKFFEVEDENWFKNISRIIYDDALDVAILLPNDEQHEKYRLLLENENTDLELWTPRLIKGLEYSVVIAVNPWHISKKHFSDVVTQDSIENWQQAENYIRKNNRTDSENVRKHIEGIKLLAKQRLRHSNIMLSRGMDKLFIISQNDSDMISTKELDFESVETNKENGNQGLSWFGETNKSNYQGINRLIKRLSLIILSSESEGDRKQVMFKSKHILNTLFTKHKYHDSLPFFLLSNITPAKDLDILAIGLNKLNKQLGLISPFSELDKKEGQIESKWSDFLDLKEFWDYAKDTARFCTKDENGDMRIPILHFNDYNSNLEKFISRFSRTSQFCFELEDGYNTTSEQDYQIKVISDYIIQRLFGGRREGTVRVDEWCEAAKTIDLKDFSIVINEDRHPRFTLIVDISEHDLFQTTERKMKNKQRKEVEAAFWKEGEHHISRIYASDLQKISKRLHGQLKKNRNSLSYEGVKFLSKLVPLSLTDKFSNWRITDKLSKENVRDLCDICNTLQREADNQKYELKPLFSQIKEEIAETVAVQLTKYSTEEFVRKSILQNSFGLFDLLKHFMEKPSFQEFTFEKSLQLGKCLVSDLSKQAVGDGVGQKEWEHPAIKQIQSHSLSLINRSNFVSKDFVNSLDMKEVRGVLERRHDKEATFSSSLRWELSDVERKNIILFSLKKLFITEIQGKKTIVKKPAMKELVRKRMALFPMLEIDEDREKWRDIFNDAEFSKELVKVPYGDDRNDISPDIYFGRIPGRFIYAKNWNAFLSESLVERGLGDGMAEAIKEIEKHTDSVFDQCKETIPRAKKLVHDYMQENILSSRWRESILRDGVNLEKGWTYGFIPKMSAKQSIILYVHLERLKSNTLKSLKSIQTSCHNTLETASEAKEFSKFLPRDERRDFTKGFKQLSRAIKPELESMLERVDKAINEITRFNVKDVLEKLILYFHRVDGNSNKVITLRKKWKILADEFLDYQYPYCFELLGNHDNYRANSEFADANGTGQLNLFSLSFMNKECQIALIVFTQKFATETNYIPGNTPVRIQTPEEVREYSVIMPDKLGSIEAGLQKIRQLPTSGLTMLY